MKTIEERFWAKVDKSGDCWVWIGSRTQGGRGYGQIMAGGGSARLLAAHRVSWEIHRGTIPDGLRVLHRCDSPPCVNPDHLFLGSHADNMRDMSDKGRPARMKLSNDEAREIRAAMAAGESPSSVAARAGIHVATARRIRRGESRPHAVPCDRCDRAEAEAAALRSALLRCVAEASKPSDPDAERWDQDINKPYHFAQEALSTTSGRDLLAERDSLRLELVTASDRADTLVEQRDSLRERCKELEEAGRHLVNQAILVDFRDEHGHPLENLVAFQALDAALNPKESE